MAQSWGEGFDDLSGLMDHNVKLACGITVASNRETPSQKETLMSMGDLKRGHEPEVCEEVLDPAPVAIFFPPMASLSLAMGAAVHGNPVLAHSFSAQSAVRDEVASSNFLGQFDLVSSRKLAESKLVHKTKGKPLANLSQAGSLQAQLIVSAPSSKPKSLKAASMTTAFPDLLRLPFSRRGTGDPGGVVAGNNTSIMWFRSDLRIHDNEALLAAHNESRSILPVYCFDPRDYGKSASGFDKTGPYRAKFLLDCVADLRRNLRERGSDLIVRVGRPEEVLLKLAKAVGANALYAHQEVTSEEVDGEDKVAALLREEGVESKFFWGSTLFHVDDLPFRLEDMPHNYGGFREKVQSVRVRKTLDMPRQMRTVPASSAAAAQAGNIPTLQDLGLAPLAPQARQEAEASYSLIGGESEALKRLKEFGKEARAGANRRSRGAQGGSSTSSSSSSCSLYGANFSCKISPWLAMGCLSPRLMREDLHEAVTQSSGGASHAKGAVAADTSSLNWLVFELLWRDFFRFIQKKYNGHKPRPVLSVASGGTAAFA